MNSSLKFYLQKAQNLCSKKEICCFDIKRKQKSWELSNQDINTIIDNLIENNFIDETRYSEAYANDKFRFNKWGKVKIQYELKKRNISSADINNALLQIDETEYITTLKELLKKKSALIKNTEKFKKKQKLIQFIINKGYEPDMVYKIIKE